MNKQTNESMLRQIIKEKDVEIDILKRRIKELETIIANKPKNYSLEMDRVMEHY